MSFTPQAVVLDDAPALAVVKMIAWFENPDWLFRWEDPTLERLISYSATRIPWNLINRRVEKRHQKR